MIVDSDIIIDYLRGNKKASKLIKTHQEDHSIETTDINVFELYHGAYKSKKTNKNLSNLKGFLNRIRIHSTSEDSMELAGKIASELEDSGEKIGAKDVLISGIAMLENQPILTYNKKHFKKVDDIDLIKTEIE